MFASLYIALSNIAFYVAPINYFGSRYHASIYAPPTPTPADPNDSTYPTGFPWENSDMSPQWEEFKKFLSGNGGGGVKGLVLAIAVTASILCGIRMIISTDNATYAESKNWLINILIGSALIYFVLLYMHL